jgi:hypothetical protein
MVDSALATDCMQAAARAEVRHRVLSALVDGRLGDRELCGDPLSARAGPSPPSRAKSASIARVGRRRCE